MSFIITFATIACRDDWGEYEQEIFREHEVSVLCIHMNILDEKFDPSLFFKVN